MMLFVELETSFFQAEASSLDRSSFKTKKFLFGTQLVPILSQRCHFSSPNRASSSSVRAVFHPFRVSSSVATLAVTVLCKALTSFAEGNFYQVQ